jgi:hypothetical protein
VEGNPRSPRDHNPYRGSDKKQKLSRGTPVSSAICRRLIQVMVNPSGLPPARAASTTCSGVEGVIEQKERSVIQPSELAPLLYRCFVETEPTPMVAVPDWPQLPELTRQRWVQMATLLGDRLQASENSKKAQSQ